MGEPPKKLSKAYLMFYAHFNSDTTCSAWPSFDAFGWLTAVLHRAVVVLVLEFCLAIPRAVDEPLCMRWSIHQLMHCSHRVLFVFILRQKPSVLYKLPCQLVAETLECWHGIGMAKETVRKESIHL
jgi:hypothetical protein